MASPIIPSLFVFPPLPPSRHCKVHRPDGKITWITDHCRGRMCHISNLRFVLIGRHASWRMLERCWWVELMVADQAGRQPHPMPDDQPCKATLARYENTTSTECGTKPALVSAVRRRSLNALCCLWYRGHPSPFGRKQAPSRSECHRPSSPLVASRISWSADDLQPPTTA